MSYFDGWHLQLTTIGDICNIRNSCDVSKIGSADSKWYELRIGILALAGHHGIGCTGKHILYVIHFVVLSLIHISFCSMYFQCTEQKVFLVWVSLTALLQF